MRPRATMRIRILSTQQNECHSAFIELLHRPYQHLRIRSVRADPCGRGSARSPRDVHSSHHQHRESVSCSMVWSGAYRGGEGAVSGGGTSERSERLWRLWSGWELYWDSCDGSLSNERVHNMLWWGRVLEPNRYGVRVFSG